MTKRELIRELYGWGKKPKEIADITGISYKYVANTIRDIENPGVLGAAIRSWRKKYPEKQARHVRLLQSMHRNLTRPKARNHRQQWTTAEVEYLQEHGQEESAHQIALKLGRTYVAILRAGRKFGIDLRGNKMGKGCSRFIGIYKNQLDSDAAPASA